MKFFTILSALAITALANNQWYDPDKDVTCAGHEGGQILCAEGHLDDAPEVSVFSTS